jgi:hypothetical protein
MKLTGMDFTAAGFERSLIGELSARGSELPLSNFCEQGGTPTNIAVNLHDARIDGRQISAQLEVIFDERFPLGCGNALQERPRRAKFQIAIDQNAACRLTPIDDPSPDL